jgi:RNase II-type exonuclease
MLAELPATMARGDQRANRLDSADVSLVEAAVLSGREGEVFDGVVVDLDERHGGGIVQLAEPAVRGRVEATSGPLPLGDPIRVRLLEADVERRVVRFAAARR